MEASTIPDLPAPAPKSSWPVKVVLTGLIVALVAWVGYSVFKPSKQITPLEPPAVSPFVPRIDYQALVNAETGKASARSHQLATAYRRAIENLDAKFTKQIPVAAYDASVSAATYISILSLISHLVWDKVKGTNGAESYLTSKIEPSITPVVDEFRVNLNSETAKFNNELQKVTVQLAANIATIGPGESRAPPRVVSEENFFPEFQTLLKQLGWNATANSVFRSLNMANLIGPNVLSALTSSVRKIALGMFGKQIAKVAAMPVVAVAAGPFAIFVGALNVAWLTYDIHRMQADFEDQVFFGLKIKLDEIRTTSKTTALNFASTRARDIQKIQDEIGSQALKTLEKQEAK